LLLMAISFILVSFAHTPEAPPMEEPAAQSGPESLPVAEGNSL
jgi:hypothetical protein